MHLLLTVEEAQLFRQFLQDSVAALGFEIARTEARELRHLLVEREKLCLRLLDQLARADPVAS